MSLRICSTIIIAVLLGMSASCSYFSSESTTPDEPEGAAEQVEATPEAGEAEADAPEAAGETVESSMEGAVDADVPAEPVAVEPDETEAEPAVDPRAGLTDPSKAVEKAPASFRVKFETTKGPVIIELNRGWSPRGVDRFYNLVRVGFFEDIAFFRVLDGFVAQFGISGNPSITSTWTNAIIQDDPVKTSNLRGTLTFATGGPNTRTTQLFINLVDNANLDRSGFSPIGKIVEGMEAVDALYSGYGEGAPMGPGPSQGLISSQGNSYLRQKFPNLDYIKSASLVD